MCVALLELHGALTIPSHQPRQLPLLVGRVLCPLLVRSRQLIGERDQTMHSYPSFFEVVKGTTAGGAGAHLVPNSIALSVGSLGAGFVSSTCARRIRC